MKDLENEYISTEIREIENGDSSEISDYNDDLLEESEEEFSDGSNSQDSNELFAYKNKLKDLIKKIAVEQEIEGIRLSRSGHIRLQQNMKFLTAALLYETMDIIKRGNRVTIAPAHIDEALTKILEGADGLNVAIAKINDLSFKLQTLNKNTAIERAFLFLNDLENTNTEE
jgi:hypothetical protein